MSNRFKINIARAPLVILLILEAAILYSSLFVSVSLRFQGAENTSDAGPGPILPAALLTIVMLLSLTSMGLYHFHQRAWFNEIFVRVIVGLLSGSAVMAAIAFVAPEFNLAPATGAIAFLYSLALILASRSVFLRLVDNSVFRRRTLVYGAGQRATSISNIRRVADQRGFEIVGFVPAPGDTVRQKIDKLFDADTALLKIAEQGGAEEIVVAMDDRRGNLPERELLDCKLRGIEILDLLEFLERETGKIRIDLVQSSWLIFSPGFRITRPRRFTMRIVDLAFGIVLSVLSVPLLIGIAVAIKFEDGLFAGVFYRQQRVGLHGKAFDLVKFRSMRLDAEADGKDIWAAVDDERNTKVGHYLRRFRLDELPQLFNVVRGHMSLVGPRPERPAIVEKLNGAIPFYPERHTVKPGITGWAQVRYTYAASQEDAIEKLQYDLYYVKNHSLLLDLIIILQTVEVILWTKGAR